MQSVIGNLASLTIYNEKWGRGSIRTEDGSSLNVVGAALVGLSEGGRYKFDGKLIKHPKFGVQLDVAVAAIDIPCNEDALVRHLKRHFKGCGAVTAKKIVEQYSGRLHELRDALVSNPYALDFSGVTKRKVSVSGDSDIKTLIYRDLSTQLGVEGVRDGILRRLADWLLPQSEAAENPVAEAWSLFTKNPFAPISEVDGYAFASADAIARRTGFPRFHESRLAALATHALREGCEQNGHTYLTLADINERIAEIDSDVDPNKAMHAAMLGSEPVMVDGDRFYPRHLYYSEVTLADNLASRIKGGGQPIVTMSPQLLDHEIRMAEKQLGEHFVLDDSQRKAVFGIMTSDKLVHTLTAGPGCGKTALMEILVFVARHKKILFCAPTGKASKVLSSRVARYDLAASTIHTLLGVTEEGFTYNETNPLDADIIIADESSMDDLALTRALMDAVPYSAHVIFLGDTDQLPSVGPGQVLANLLQMPLDHHRLTTTHRNDGGILDVVRQAGTGWCDCTDREDVKFSHGLPDPDDIGITKLVNAYLRNVEKHGIKHIGLLMPRRKGDISRPGWNTTYLNEIIRQKLNPEGQRVLGTTLRIGDRIIIRKNQLLEQEEGADGKKRHEQVVNGDTGMITHCFTDAEGTSIEFLLLELDDGRVIRYPGKAVDHLSLAYAMTVHASQGSEYKVVIFICTNGSPTFVHRGIVYTAFSRAKQKLMVLGDDQVIRNICRREIPKRNSLLVQRVQECLMKDLPVPG